MLLIWIRTPFHVLFFFFFDNKKNDLKFSGYSNNCKYYLKLIREFENDLES